MEIKSFLPVSSGKLTVFFLNMVMAALLFLPGCMRMPGPFETTEDYIQQFHNRSRFTELTPGKELSLHKAVETALLNNPTNLAAAQAVNAARYGYYRALSAYAPELNIAYSLGHTLSRGWDLKNPPVGVMKRNNHFVTSGTINASFLLFDGFARELESIIAREEYNKSTAAEKNVKRLLERATAFAYLDMYLAEEEMVIYGEDLDFQNDALRQEEERFRLGHVSKASVLNFRILAARARSNISSARFRRQIAFHALSALMGYAPGALPEDIKLQKTSTSAPAQIYDEDFYLELAVTHRPDLQAEKIAFEIAYRNKQKAFSDFFPEFRLYSDFTLDTYNARYGGYRVSRAHSQQGGFTYGVEGRWNIFRGFDTVNALRRQQSLEKAALWGLNAKFLEVAAEVRDARSNCLNTRYQIKIYQEMAEWVKEQRDLVFSEYCNGRETITRLNEAQATLTEARSRLAVSAIEFSKAAAQLAAAVGLPAPRPPE